MQAYIYVEFSPNMFHLTGGLCLNFLHDSQKNIFQYAIVYGLLGSWLADCDMCGILNLIMISACQVLS
jgi:hypothetical protein